ncbi:hypothetical protein BDW42DRAFT_155171 [Aspergillus taichungensis]|uniref:DUF7732 domain-containing protein n=1 Tax=Aspergillus taichungensis TaxID=482145 RepID=A0A2J5HKT1_9EURO|nr:hypothetical protein BDW42DRAFT_155171 [Aspergillus taichungensis]
MKLPSAAAVFLLLASTATSLSVPPSDLAVRDLEVTPRSDEFPDLEKRRGGGGRGGGGGGSSGGGSGGRGGGGGSSSGSGGSGGGSSSGGRTGSSSNTGRRSPLGLAPFLLPATALAFFPGLWLYGAYAYPYSHPYHYTNHTDNKNESLPVVCLCEEHAECGCDDNNKNSYYESLFNGTEPKNGSNVRVVEVNGTEKIFINGTLPNGTTADESNPSSTSNDPNASTALSSAPGPAVALLHASGYWVMVVVVISSVYML